MPITWTTLHQHFKGKWVGLADDEQTVLGVGVTTHEALANALKQGHKSPILTRVPHDMSMYIARSHSTLHPHSPHSRVARSWPQRSSAASESRLS
jgi:hypothetical protein